MLRRAIAQALTRRADLCASARGFAADAAGDVGRCSGVPTEALARKVIIYSPARSSSQHGKGGLGRWRIQFEENQRWENPLMGWTSTGDSLSTVARASSGLDFDSKEAAIAFVERQGWSWEALQPHKFSLGNSIIRGAGKRGTRVKQYGDNFAVARKGIPVWPYPAK